MIKIGLFTCILIFSFGLLTAQENNASRDFEVQLSEPHETVDSGPGIYLNNEDNVLSFKIIKINKFVIQSFDPLTLNELSRAENQLEDKTANFEMFVLIDKRFYVFYTVYDKPGDTENLYAQEVDPNTSKFTGGPKSLLSINGKIAPVSNIGWYQKVSDKFAFEHSKSKDKLLVHFRMKPENKNDAISYDKVGLYAFDSGLNKIWGAIREMKYTEAQMDFVDYAIDNEANAYILAKIFKDGNKDQKKHGDEQINYRYELLKLNGSNENAEYSPLELDDNRFLEAASIQELDDNHLLIAGFYSNANSESIEGTFTFVADKNTFAFKKNYYEIPLEVINAYESKRDVKKNSKDEDAGFANLSLRNIIVDDDANITLIGEQYDTKNRQSSNGGTLTEYHYGNILVTKVNAQGELSWMTKIPKKQVGANGKGDMSYAKLATDNFLYILYLDNEKNNELPMDEEPKQHIDGKGGFLTSTKINLKSGEVSKENLFDLSDVNGIETFNFTTGRIINLSDDKIAVEVYKKKKEDIWIKVGLN